jgi:hypothetical protein
LTTQAGDFLADAFASTQQRYTEVAGVVDHNRVHLTRAKDAQELLIGENREPANLADSEFTHVAADFLEKLGRQLREDRPKTHGNRGHNTDCR